MITTPGKLIVSALVGGFVGYLVADWMYVKMYNPVESYEDSEEFPHDGEDMLVEEVTMEPIIMKKNAPRERRAPVRDYTKAFNEMGRPELAALAAKYKPTEGATPVETEPDEEFDEELLQDIINEVETEQDPSVISFNEFLNDDTNFQRVTLHYYSGDDVVTDDKENPIANPESFLGDDALVSFGEESGDPDVVYVRNREKKALYEIAQFHRPFANQVQVRRHRAALTPRKVKEENGEADDN
jgi:hypothetical protein